MNSPDRVPVLAWVVLGVLVAVSALAVLAAYGSPVPAAVVILVGMATALLVACWPVRPAAGHRA